jgi:SAM-dependent methyltransferase
MIMDLDVEQYWDAVAERVDATRTAEDEREHSGNLGPVTRYKRRRLLAALAPLDVLGREVLEVGPGAGGNCALLHRRGARVRGVDISAEMVKLARSRNATWCDGDTFVHAPGSRWPLPDASFDLIFTVTVLQHNLDDAAVESLAREMRRVLRPGGNVICFEDTLQVRRRDFSWVGRTRRDYEAIFARAGLRTCSFEMIGFFHFWAFNRLRRIRAIHSRFVRDTERTTTASPIASGGEGQRVSGGRRVAEAVAVAVGRPIDWLWRVPEGLGAYRLAAE